MKICVVGAGIVGLSSALRIQEACPKADVNLISEKFSPNTTSDVSGGFWGPHLVDVEKQPAIRTWARETFDYMVTLARSSDAGQTGAQLISGYSMPKEDPWFKDIIFGYRDMTEEELRLFPEAKNGEFFTSVMLDVRSYLPWLLTRFRAIGGTIIKRKVNSWMELADEYDIVVNCCGVYARDLSNDESLQPVRGQLLRVHAPWIKHFVLCEHPQGSSYILPSAFDVVLGGTHEQNDWNENVDEEVRETIRSGCTKLVPSLQGIKSFSDWVGLRPFRPTVRLELETLKTPRKNMLIVHNYGHGGSGVTLHWGCAKEAARLVAKAIQAQITTTNL
ncbi:hypothetical protein ScPMuIL_006316 [Solemya velum]